MHIALIQPHQADAAAALIRRNLLEIVSKDYPPEYITSLLDHFSPAQLLEDAQTQHFFVAMEGDTVIGTAGLADYGTADAPRYYGVTVFVQPEHHGSGVGRQLMAAVEAQAVALGATQIIVRAAVGARGFYKKLGYAFQNGREVPDERGNYIMEKVLPNPVG